jgi:putative membrane protein
MRNNNQSSVINFIKGFIIGSSDVVPGVSGGTMALVLGIYERLIGDISSISREGVNLFKTRDWRRFWRSIDWQFLFPLVVGVLTAIILFAGPLTYALHTEPELVWAFFFGLVAGSVYFVSRRVGVMTMKLYIIALAGFVVAYVISGMIPRETVASPVMFVLAGAVAISATILPGISGSFVLLIIGKYEQILGAVHTRDISVLFFVIVGIVIGLMLFSRVVSWLLERYHEVTIVLLIGLMMGSMRKLWPWKVGASNVFPIEMDGRFFLIISLIFLGCVSVFYLEKLSNKKKTYET